MSKYCAYIPSSHLDSQNSQIFCNNLFTFIMELSSQYSIWQGKSEKLWRDIRNKKVAIKNLKNFLKLNRFIVPSANIQNWQSYDLYLSMARKRNDYVYFVEELDFYFVVCGQVLYAYFRDKIAQRQLNILATKHHLACIVDDNLSKAYTKPRFSTRAIHCHKLQKLIDENMQTIMLKCFGISPELEDIKVYKDFDSEKYITQYAECFYITLWNHWLSVSECEKFIQDYVFDRGVLKSDVRKMKHRMQCEQKLLDFILWIYKSFSVYKSGIHRYKDKILLYQTFCDEFVLDFYRLMRNGGGFWWYIAEEKTWVIANEEYVLTFISFGNAAKIKSEAKSRDLFVLC